MSETSKVILSWVALFAVGWLVRAHAVAVAVLCAVALVLAFAVWALAALWRQGARTDALADPDRVVWPESPRHAAGPARPRLGEDPTEWFVGPGGSVVDHHGRRI